MISICTNSRSLQKIYSIEKYLKQQDCLKSLEVAECQILCNLDFLPKINDLGLDRA